MDKLKTLAKDLKENADLAFSLLGLLGFGSLVAFMEDARAMVCDHPVACAFLCLASACAGYAFATGGRWAKRRQKEESLRRVFESLSERRKALVARALDEGSVECLMCDPDATVLMEAGILGCPPLVSRFDTAPLAVQPRVVLEIKKHRAEWLGM